MRTGLMQLVLFVLGIVAAAVLSTTTNVLYGQTAPAGASSQASFDIVGFRPGMPLQDAYNMLKAYNPKVPIQPGEEAVREISDKKLPYALRLPEGPTPHVGEQIQLEITLPPSRQVVWKIVRELNFEQGSEPTVASLTAALRQKYGQEVSPLLPNAANFYWEFDERGQRIAGPPRLAPTCGSVVGKMAELGTDSSVALIPRVAAPLTIPACKAMTVVSASIDSGADKRLATRMVVAVTDLGLGMRAWQATLDQVVKVRSGQDKQNLEKAGQRPIPKL